MYLSPVSGARSNKECSASPLGWEMILKVANPSSNLLFLSGGPKTVTGVSPAMGSSWENVQVKMQSRVKTLTFYFYPQQQSGRPQQHSSWSNYQSSEPE